MTPSETADAAQTAMASLTEPQRNAVRVAAGDDPAEQLRVLQLLQPTWSGRQPGETYDQHRRRDPLGAFLDSHTHQAPPPPAAATEREIQLARDYDTAKRSNPIQAAALMRRYGRAILRGRPAARAANDNGRTSP